MIAKVVAITPNSELKAIGRLLEHHRVNLLPVIDDEQRLVGVVTEADLLST